MTLYGPWDIFSFSRVNTLSDRETTRARYRAIRRQILVENDMTSFLASADIFNQKVTCKRQLHVHRLSIPCIHTYCRYTYLLGWGGGRGGVVLVNHMKTTDFGIPNIWCSIRRCTILLYYCCLLVRLFLNNIYQAVTVRLISLESTASNTYPLL